MLRIRPLIVVVALAGCTGPEPAPPEAVITGLVLSPTREPFAGAEVVARVWLDPPECVGETPEIAGTVSGNDGSFTLHVTGSTGVRQEPACVIVSARPGGTSGFIPGGSGPLQTTLRSEAPPDTLAIEIVIGNPPPP
jgi:hypothetical protein